MWQMGSALSRQLASGIFTRTRRRNSVSDQSLCHGGQAPAGRAGPNLSTRRFLCGDDYTIADIATCPGMAPWCCTISTRQRNFSMSPPTPMWRAGRARSNSVLRYSAAAGSTAPGGRKNCWYPSVTRPLTSPLCFLVPVGLAVLQPPGRSQNPARTADRQFLGDCSSATTEEPACYWH